MYDCGIFNYSNLSSAKSHGYGMSLGVIESYSAILDSLEESFNEYLRGDMYDDELDELWEDILQDDISYEIYLLKPECLTNFSMAELEDKLSDDPQGFIQEYGIPLDD